MRILGRYVAALAALAFFVMASGPAQAGSITEDYCEEELGAFTGLIAYVPTNSTSGVLTISLTNTSPAANGGYITAFVFNNPGDVITAVTLDSSPTGFSTLLGASNPTAELVSASPWSNFDLGVSVGGNDLTGFQAGGSPNDGIGVGETGTFVFSLTGTGMDALSQASFEQALSGGPGDKPDAFMIVRFRGFEDDGSDKCTAVVPLPAAAWSGMAVLGLLGGLKAVRRMRG